MNIPVSETTALTEPLRINKFISLIQEMGRERLPLSIAWYQDDMDDIVASVQSIREAEDMVVLDIDFLMPDLKRTVFFSRIEIMERLTELSDDRVIFAKYPDNDNLYPVVDCGVFPTNRIINGDEILIEGMRVCETHL